MKNNKDFLTGIFSYQYFVENYDNFIKNYSQAKLIAFDLTEFKSINDNYGHQAGDECLINFAHLLNGLFSGSDICVRRSGDEFLVLTNKNDYEIEFLLTQIINTISRNYNEGLFEITYGFNAGVCPVELNMKTTEKKADDTLYEAKKSKKSFLYFSNSFYNHVDELREYADKIGEIISKDDIQYRTRKICALNGKETGISDIYAIDGFTKNLIVQERLEELRKYSCLKKFDFTNLKKIITYASIPKGNKLMININGQSLVTEDETNLLSMFLALKSISLVPLERFTICINIDNVPNNMINNLLSKISLLSDMGLRIALQNYSLITYNAWLRSTNDIDFIKIGKEIWKKECENNSKIKKALKTNLQMLVEAGTLPIFMKVENYFDLDLISELDVTNSLIVGDASGHVERPLKLIKKQG